MLNFRWMFNPRAQPVSESDRQESSGPDSDQTLNQKNRIRIEPSRKTRFGSGYDPRVQTGSGWSRRNAQGPDPCLTLKNKPDPNRTGKKTQVQIRFGPSIRKAGS